MRKEVCERAWRRLGWSLLIAILVIPSVDAWPKIRLGQRNLNATSQDTMVDGHRIHGDPAVVSQYLQWEVQLNEKCAIAESVLKKIDFESLEACVKNEDLTFEEKAEAQSLLREFDTQITNIDVCAFASAHNMDFGTHHVREIRIDGNASVKLNATTQYSLQEYARLCQECMAALDRFIESESRYSVAANHAKELVKVAVVRAAERKERERTEENALVLAIVVGSVIVIVLYFTAMWLVSSGRMTVFRGWGDFAVCGVWTFATIIGVYYTFGCASHDLNTLGKVLAGSILVCGAGSLLWIFVGSFLNNPGHFFFSLLALFARFVGSILVFIGVMQIVEILDRAKKEHRPWWWTVFRLMVIDLLFMIFLKSMIVDNRQCTETT